MNNEKQLNHEERAQREVVELHLYKKLKSIKKLYKV